MSSKLLRGASIATEQVAWRQVGSGGEVAGEGQSFSSYISEPGLPSSGPRAPGEVEQRLQAAYQQGFEAGQVAGRQSLAPELEAMQMKLARSIQELAGARLRYRREAEQDVVALALAVARRILHRELTMAPEALLGLVKAALDKMEAQEAHQARVSREDAAMVRHFLEQMGLPQAIEVIADPDIERGGVILESSRGALDASVDTQLSEIGRGFADLARRTS